MLKVIGAITLVGALGFGAAYYGGFVEADVDAKVTPKGRQAAADGLGEVQEGINTGLKKAREAVGPQRP